MKLFSGFSFSIGLSISILIWGLFFRLDWWDFWLFIEILSSLNWLTFSLEANLILLTSLAYKLSTNHALLWLLLSNTLFDLLLYDLSKIMLLFSLSTLLFFSLSSTLFLFSLPKLALFPVVAILEFAGPFFNFN